VSDLLSLLGFVFGAVIIDWLAVSRCAAYSTEFDYCYLPFTRARKLGLAAVILAATDMWSSTPADAALWKQIFFGILVVLWAITIYVDVTAQRHAGYREPPRYSDDEYGS
jgi:hypothetical protein